MTAPSSAHPSIDFSQLIHNDFGIDFNESYDSSSWEDRRFGDRFPAYRGRFQEEVSFFRPDGDVEGKDVLWCLTNGFEEIVKGLWSGPWFDRYHPNERERLKQIEAQIRRENNLVRDERALQRYQEPYYEWMEDQMERGSNFDPIPEIFRDDPKMPCYCPHKCNLDGCGEYFNTEEELENHQAYCRECFACPVRRCANRFPNESMLGEHIELDHPNKFSDDPLSPFYKPWHCPIKRCRHRSRSKGSLLLCHLYWKSNDDDGCVEHSRWMEARFNPEWEEEDGDGNDCDSEEYFPYCLLISEIPKPKGQTDIRMYFSKEFAEKERCRIRDIKQRTRDIYNHRDFFREHWLCATVEEHFQTYPRVQDLETWLKRREKQTLKLFKRRASNRTSPSCFKARRKAFKKRHPLYAESFGMQVLFLQSDGTRVKKDIEWCLEHSFEHVAHNLWSGPWFDEICPGERQQL